MLLRGDRKYNMHDNLKFKQLWIISKYRYYIVASNVRLRTMEINDYMHRSR